MKHKILLAFSLLTLQNFYQVAAESDQSFTVYCTGNQDTTGSCLRTGNPEDNKKLECIMVPGNIIDCKSGSDENIECILITATSAQAEFSCNKSTIKPLKSIETTSSQDLDYQEESIDGNGTKDVNDSQNNLKSNIFTDPF